MHRKQNSVEQEARQAAKKKQIAGGMNKGKTLTEEEIESDKMRKKLICCSRQANARRQGLLARMGVALMLQKKRQAHIRANTTKRFLYFPLYLQLPKNECALKGDCYSTHLNIRPLPSMSMHTYIYVCVCALQETPRVPNIVVLQNYKLLVYDNQFVTKRNIIRCDRVSGSLSGIYSQKYDRLIV